MMHPGCGGDLAIGNGLGRINYMNVKPSLMKCMGDRPNHGYRPIPSWYVNSYSGPLNLLPFVV